MKPSLSILLAGVVDYAGLFPPAALDMASAVRQYAEYLHDPQRAMLGRFVVPVSRLEEFETHATPLLPRDASRDANHVRNAVAPDTPWRLSALVGNDIALDLDRVFVFNRRHDVGSAHGFAVIDSIEAKVASPDDVRRVMATVACAPSAIETFLEVPVADDPNDLIAAIARYGGHAKIRTGGVTADAFPAPAHVVRFIMRCREHGVAFKATAGLHHPIRAEYRLTYDPEPPRGTMYGYLNIALAAALAWIEADRTYIDAALVETDASQLQFDDDGVRYRGVTLSRDVLRDTRDHFFHSFGSCSFREPVDDLAALALR